MLYINLWVTYISFHHLPVENSEDQVSPYEVKHQQDRQEKIEKLMSPKCWFYQVDSVWFNQCTVHHTEIVQNTYRNSNTTQYLMPLYI